MKKQPWQGLRGLQLSWSSCGIAVGVGAAIIRVSVPRGEGSGL